MAAAADGRQVPGARRPGAWSRSRVQRTAIRQPRVRNWSAQITRLIQRAPPPPLALTSPAASDLKTFSVTLLRQRSAGRR
jgi:hypothetical protein